MNGQRESYWDKPHRIAALRKLWSQDKSASEIARILGDGVTRNAVLGKVHRLGLPGRESPIIRFEERHKTIHRLMPHLRPPDVSRPCDWPDGCDGEIYPNKPYCAHHCSIAYHIKIKGGKRVPWTASRAEKMARAGG